MDTKFTPIVYEALLPEEKNFLKSKLGEPITPENIKKLEEKFPENQTKKAIFQHITQTKLRSTSGDDVSEAILALKVDYSSDPQFQIDTHYFIAMGFFLTNNYPECKMFD